MSGTRKRLGGLMLSALLALVPLTAFIIASESASAPLAPTATVRYVARGGNSSGSATPYATIQHAIGVALSGYEIRVA